MRGFLAQLSNHQKLPLSVPIENKTPHLLRAVPPNDYQLTCESIQNPKPMGVHVCASKSPFLNVDFSRFILINFSRPSNFFKIFIVDLILGSSVLIFQNPFNFLVETYQLKFHKKEYQSIILANLMTDLEKSLP